MENTLKRFCKIKLDAIKLHFDRELRKNPSTLTSKLERNTQCDQLTERIITEHYTSILPYLLKDYAHSKVTVEQKATIMSEFTLEALTLADDFRKQYCHS